MVTIKLNECAVYFRLQLTHKDDGFHVLPCEAKSVTVLLLPQVDEDVDEVPAVVGLGPASVQVLLDDHLEEGV